MTPPLSSLSLFPLFALKLQETRLGRLINDVRKKTENEELAKRAKKLLRNWQKLIEPVAQNEAALRGLPNPPGSANGGAHNCRVETPPGAGPKPVPDAKSRNDVQKPHSPKPGTRKRKGGGEPRDGLQGPPSSSSSSSSSLPKATKGSHEAVQNSSPPPTNGIGGSPESFPSPPEEAEGVRAEESGEKPSGKIPINAVRPHTSSPAGLFKPSGLPAMLKTAVLYEKAEDAVATGGQPRSPRCPSFSPRSLRLETFARQHAAFSSSLAVVAAEGPTSSRSPPAPEAAPEAQLFLPGAAASPGGPLPEPFSPGVLRGDSSDGFEGKKKKKSRPKDYAASLDGPGSEGGGGVKPVRLKKERRLTFDPMTGEIKPLAQRDSLLPAASVSVSADLPAFAEQPPLPPVLSPPSPSSSSSQRTVPEAKGLPLHSPFEQTNWKELSRNEIIQSYLTRQSSLLSSSGAQTPGAHYFMSEYLRQEESTRREARKTHVLAPHGKGPSDLPGVTRELTPGDLERIGGRRWPGVNGCYDTQGNWYDWTQCISLDPHGDDGRLNILPYVCLD
uniref:TFIIS N-terminal domain-containing protein n=1 Tax=Anolis carolinensis TaxID=28377 RepID=H9GKT2_ANOCA